MRVKQDIQKHEQKEKRRLRFFNALAPIFNNVPRKKVEYKRQQLRWNKNQVDRIFYEHQPKQHKIGACKK